MPDTLRPAAGRLFTQASQKRRNLLRRSLIAGLGSALGSGPGTGLGIGLGIGLGFSLTACSATPFAAAADAQPLTNASTGKRLHIMLDPGHTPLQGGATGVRGIREVRYNDHFTQMLASALQAAGHRVSVTRTPDQEITLDQRAELANASNADLFLAIHHDSAQLQYLDKIEVDGLSAWRTKIPIRGYSVFVSQINPRYETSLAHARAIAAQLLALGRPPTLHHAEKIAGENRELLDQRLGLYRFDELLVLRKTKIPALLLELGVIVDAHDEAYVSDPARQKTMITAIVGALSGAEPALSRPS